MFRLYHDDKPSITMFLFPRPFHRHPVLKLLAPAFQCLIFFFIFSVASDSMLQIHNYRSGTFCIPHLQFFFINNPSRVNCREIYLGSCLPNKHFEDRGEKIIFFISYYLRTHKRRKIIVSIFLQHLKFYGPTFYSQLFG